MLKIHNKKTSRRKKESGITEIEGKSGDYRSKASEVLGEAVIWMEIMSLDKLQWESS